MRRPIARSPVSFGQRAIPGVIDDAASVAQPLQSMRGRIECDYGEPATPAPLTLLHAGCPQRQASAALSDTGDSTRLRQCSLQ
jgi:hypothetical protein